MIRKPLLWLALVECCAFATPGFSTEAQTEAKEWLETRREYLRDLPGDFEQFNEPIYRVYSPSMKMVYITCHVDKVIEIGKKMQCGYRRKPTEIQGSRTDWLRYCLQLAGYDIRTFNDYVKRPCYFRVEEMRRKIAR